MARLRPAHSAVWLVLLLLAAGQRGAAAQEPTPGPASAPAPPSSSDHSGGEDDGRSANASAAAAQLDAAAELESQLVPPAAAALARGSNRASSSGAVPQGVVTAWSDLELAQQELDEALSKAPAAGGDGPGGPSAGVSPEVVAAAQESVERVRAEVEAQLAAVEVQQRQQQLELGGYLEEETADVVTAASLDQYGEALEASYLFYEAQRSGVLPENNRVPWRRSAHTADLVPGGWYDAGDYIKHSLTIAQSATFLAWGALDFSAGHTAAAQAGWAREAVLWAGHYLRACHIGPGLFVGLVGNPDIDHNFWGRPEEQPVGPTKRPAYVWNTTQPAGDMLGIVAASLASASMVARPGNATDADSLLAHAQELYAWGAAAPGRFSKSMPDYPWVYATSTWNDKLMLAASWLYRATGNATYLEAAHGHWIAAGGRNGGEASPYVSWDAVFAPAVVNLLGVGEAIGAANVPGHTDYLAFFATFKDVWVKADGAWSVKSTPRGLRYATWSKWGNLRYSSNAAMTMLLRAHQLPAGNAERASLVSFARSQIDYAIGAIGRSFVVGYGASPPLFAHHAAASCEDPPARCDWSDFSKSTPNPQVLIGALVAGPAGPGDDTYHDRRNDYVTIDYNAGLTAALAGLLTLDTA